MRRYLRLFLTPIDAAWCFSAVAMPVFMLAGESALWPMAGALLAMALFGMLLGLAFDRRRFLFGIPAGAALAYGFFAISGGLSPEVWRRVILAVLALPPYLWCLRNAPLPIDVSYGPKRLLPALVLLAADYGLAVFQGAEVMRRTVMWVGVLYLLVFLFLSNEDMVASAARKQRGSRLPPGLLAANRVMIAVFAALSLLLFGWSELSRWVGAGVGYLIIAVLWLMDKVTSLMAGGSGEGGGGGGGMDMSALGEAPPPNPIVEIVTAIVMYLALAAAAIALLYALYRIGKKAAAALRALLARWWTHYREAFSEGYVDENQSIMHLDETARELRDALVRRVQRLLSRPPRWEALDDRARVRYAMQVVLRRALSEGKTVHAQTVEELRQAKVISCDHGDAVLFARAYERARYSQEPVTAQDAANARRMMK